MKTVSKNFGKAVPKSKSNKRNMNTASIKNEKYAIPAKAKTTDIQKGRKSIEKRSNREEKILKIIIVLYITMKPILKPDLCFLKIKAAGI